MALYTERRVKKLVERIQEEYETALAAQRELAESLKEENRIVKARLAELESERASVSDAFILASKAGDARERERAAETENELREIRLLAEKCRLLSEDLQRRYPDEADIQAYAAYCEQLRAVLGEEPQAEEEFNMDDVIAPKEPLDLGKLCRDLGLMEEES